MIDKPQLWFVWSRCVWTLKLYHLELQVQVQPTMDDPWTWSKHTLKKVLINSKFYVELKI